MHCLINLLYIKLLRYYLPITKINNQNYLVKLRSLENLINHNYKTQKYPHRYATRMNLSEKHLSRIIKGCLNKLTLHLIAERVILEAKRLLIQSKYTISEIANELGHEDNSYFSHFFKKHGKQSPIDFLKSYR